MMRPLLTVCALLVILTAALRFSLPLRQEGGEGQGEVAAVSPPPAAASAQLTRPAASTHDRPGALAHDFRPDFFDLLAPFETNDDTDPFMREKRAAAFQSRIDLLDPSEIASAYHTAAAIQNTHPSESATDLRDRLLQRWRELDPASIHVIESATAETTSLPAEIIALSDTDPISAAQRALDQLPRDQQQINILIGIVQRLAAVDPPAALAWVNQFPEGDLRDRALSQLRRVNPTHFTP
jgi:hypothetical protein